MEVFGLAVLALHSSNFFVVLTFAFVIQILNIYVLSLSFDNVMKLYDLLLQNAFLAMCQLEDRVHVEIDVQTLQVRADHSIFLRQLFLGLRLLILVPLLRAPVAAAVLVV